jgi:sorbitol/mannitol transport system permease protein
LTTIDKYTGSDNQRRLSDQVLAITPSVTLLFLWMAVPLAMTLYFSFIQYNLLIPAPKSFAGFSNYYFFLTDPAFATALINTLIIVGGALLITVVGGILLALLLDQPFFGQGIVRLLVISPFFVLRRSPRWSGRT